MTTLTAANYDLVTDRLARIMLDESATEQARDERLQAFVDGRTDDLSIDDFVSLFATLPADSRQRVLQMGRIFQAGGAAADELHALCDRGDMAAVQRWLAARVN